MKKSSPLSVMYSSLINQRIFKKSSHSYLYGQIFVLNRDEEIITPKGDDLSITKKIIAFSKKNCKFMPAMKKSSAKNEDLFIMVDDF